MIAVNQSVYGVAGTASVIACTVVGTEDNAPQVLAQGLLSDTTRLDELETKLTAFGVLA